MSNLVKAVPHASIAKAALRDIKYLAATFRGILSLADELGDVQDLKEMQKQEQQVVDQLKAETSRLTNEIGKKAVELARLSNEAESLKAEAQAQQAFAVEIDKIKSKLGIGSEA